jgi:hypothetical protein
MRAVSNPAVSGLRLLNPGTFSIELPPFVSIILPGRIRLSLTAEMMLVVDDSGVNALWIEVCRDVIY